MQPLLLCFVHLFLLLLPGPTSPCPDRKVKSNKDIQESGGAGRTWKEHLADSTPESPKTGRRKEESQDRKNSNESSGVCGESKRTSLPVHRGVFHLGHDREIVLKQKMYLKNFPGCSGTCTKNCSGSSAGAKSSNVTKYQRTSKEKDRNDIKTEAVAAKPSFGTSESCELGSCVVNNRQPQNCIQECVKECRNGGRSDHPSTPLKVWVWSKSHHQMLPYRLWFQEYPSKKSRDALSSVHGARSKRLARFAGDYGEAQSGGEHLVAKDELDKIGSVYNSRNPAEFYKNLLLFAKDIPRVKQMTNRPYYRRIGEPLRTAWNVRQMLNRRTGSENGLVSSLDENGHERVVSQLYQGGLDTALRRRKRYVNRRNDLRVKPIPKQFRRRKEPSRKLQKPAKSSVSSRGMSSSPRVLDLARAMNVGELSDVMILNTSLLAFEKRHAAILVFPIVFSKGCPKAEVGEDMRPTLGHTENGWWLTVYRKGRNPVLAYVPKASLRNGRNVEEVLERFGEVLNDFHRQSREVHYEQKRDRMVIRAQVACPRNEDENRC